MDVIVDMVLKNAETGEIISESSRKIVAGKELHELIEEDKKYGVYDRGVMKLELYNEQRDHVQEQITKDLQAIKKNLDALLIAGNPQCVLRGIRETIERDLQLLGDGE